jgi:peptidoglycan/xylan/chitin deacetylase (PgdA/CDA1 family)
MKRFRSVSLFSLLPLAALLAACAGRPAARVEKPVPETETFLPAEIPLPPEEILSEMDRVVRRIKKNGGDIPKYFTRDEDLRITVRADIEIFEIVYDLEGKTVPGGIDVGFRITERETGISRQERFTWEPREGEAGILLGFDDTYMETWRQYFDLFDKYGARVTFFIQGGFCSFCSEALNRGHDVGFHTLNHPDLRKQSRQKFMEETIFAAAAFREGGIPLSAFAYPFGFSEPWMHGILLEYYSLLRGYGVTFRLYDGREIRSGYITSRAIDNTVIKGEENFDRFITLMLRTVKFIGRDFVFPMTTHDISDTAAWGITPRRLEYLLKTASELKLKFYRYSDFANDRSVSPVTR